MKRAAIITASDSGYRGEREDLSGPAIKEILEREGYKVIYGKKNEIVEPLKTRILKREK